MLMQLQYRLKTRGTRADYSIALTPFSSVAGQRLQGAAASGHQIKCPGAKVDDFRLVTIAAAIGPRRQRSVNHKCASILLLRCKNETHGVHMRTTITIDDELYLRALNFADPGMDKSDLIREAMTVFVRVQAGKRLAALGGKASTMKDIPRRRPAKSLCK